MLKKLAAIGVSAAIAFAPLVALAQTDQSAPPAGGAAPMGADQGAMAPKPKKKTHHMSKMKKPMTPMAPAGGAAAPANPQ